MRTLRGHARRALCAVITGALMCTPVHAAASTARNNAPPPRFVQCAGATAQPDPALVAAYTTFFAGMPDALNRTASSTLRFESTLATELVGQGGYGDVGEMAVTINRLQAALSPLNVSIDSIISTWSDVWELRAEAAVADAVDAHYAGDVLRESQAYISAWAYLFVSERFSDHLAPASLRVYSDALTYYRRGMALAQDTPCMATTVPYVDDVSGLSYELPAYFCPPAGGKMFSAAGARATIVLMNGFDGTAELSLAEVGLHAAREGYAVLVFEGPGQAGAARFLRLLFRPDWEVVMSQVVDYAVSKYGADPASIVLWGTSMGGYLASRAFSHMPSVAALVVNGGVYDFFQAIFCQLPSVLQTMFYSSPQQFDTLMDASAATNLAANFSVTYGMLGMNVSSLSQLFRSFLPYIQDNMAGIGARPVLVYNPQLDTMVGNQSAIFYAALPQPRHSNTTLLSLDPYAGGALHCGVGTTRNVITAHIGWLNSVFAPVAAPAPASARSDAGGPWQSTGIAFIVLFCVTLVYALIATVMLCRRPHPRLAGAGYMRASQTLMDTALILHSMDTGVSQLPIRLAPNPALPWHFAPPRLPPRPAILGVAPLPQRFDITCEDEAATLVQRAEAEHAARIEAAATWTSIVSAIAEVAADEKNAAATRRASSVAAQPLPGAAASTAAAAGSAAGGAPQAGVSTDSSMLAGTSGTGVPASPVVASGVPPPVADARAPVPSTKPKGNVNWICGACDVLNVATSAQCTVCSTSRDFGTEQVVAEWVPSSAAVWHCPRCTYENSITAARCEMCNVQREQDERV